MTLPWASTNVALLGGEPGAAIEMAGFGGRFLVEGNPIVIALTGAPMRAKCAGATLAWGASHLIQPGDVFEIGPVTQGSFGYLSVSGGFRVLPFMGSASAHINAGIGARLGIGDRVGLNGANVASNLRLSFTDRFGGGELRVLKGPQTEMFDQETIDRFANCTFCRAPRGNRMGIELDGGERFSASGGLSLVSEMTVPGDIQMTGAGAPFILGPECQTTGGYPRIATVIPSDLDRAMQAAPGAEITVRFVDRAEALAALRADVQASVSLKPVPMVRDPHDIADLLSYQLVSGVVSGEDP